MEKEVFVGPKGNNWQVKVAKSSRASRLFKLKADAMKFGRSLAMKYKGELFEQDKQGHIINRNSYGNDPRNRKG